MTIEVVAYGPKGRRQEVAATSPEEWGEYQEALRRWFEWNQRVYAPMEAAAAKRKAADEAWEAKWGG